MADTPSKEQLRTMCKKVLDQLGLLRQHRQLLQRDLDTTVSNIIALQGTLAGLQAALGDPYDKQTVPMDLET